MARPPTLLDTLRVRIRRATLIVGLGVGAMVAGSIFSLALQERLSLHLAQLPWEWLQFGVVELVIRRFWLWGLLPGLCYALARVIDIKPWSTPIWAALAGQAALHFILSFNESEFDGIVIATDAVALAAGVLLGRQAVLAGRAAAGVSAEKARAAALANQDRYASFAREAERIAALKDAGPAPAAAAASASPSEVPVASGDGGPDKPPTA